VIKAARPDPTKCRVFGPGIERGEAHEPAKFTIEARNCLGDRITSGGHPFVVTVKDPHGANIPAKCADNRDGTYACEYLPQEVGDFTVGITLQGQNVAQAPYRVNIEENSKMASPFKSYMDGPALLPGNKVTELQTFTIHAVYPNGQPKKTGGDLFESMVTDPRGAKLQVNVVDNNNGTWTVTYMPTDPGKYHIEAIQRNPSLRNLFSHIKNSPQDVLIDPGTVAANCIAYGPGLEPGCLDTEPAHFTIEARDKNGLRRKEGGDPFKVEINGPTGPVACDVVDNNDGTYAVTYHPQDAGRHDIAVTLEGKPIKGSTFRVDIAAGAFAGKTIMESFSYVVKAHDKRGKPLTVGGAKITASVKKPNGQACQQTKLEDNKNGSYTVTFKAAEPGVYQVSTKIDGKDIVGSPFDQKIANF